MAKTMQFYTQLNFNTKGMKEGIGKMKEMYAELESEQKKVNATLLSYKRELESLKKSGASKSLIEDKEKEIKATKALIDGNNRVMKTLKEEMAIDAKRYNELEKNLLKIDKLGTRSLIRMKNTLSRMQKSLNDNTAEGKKKAQGIADALVAVTAEIDARLKGLTDTTKKKGEAAMRNMSMNSLKGVVEAFEKNGHSMEYTNEQMKNLGKNATDAKIRMARISGELKNNPFISREQMQSNIKFWEGIINYAGASKDQIKKAKDEMDKMKGRLASKDMDVLGNMGMKSTSEIQASMQSLQNYMNTTRLTKEEQEKFGTAIANANQYLQQQQASQKNAQMLAQLGEGYKNVTNLSNKALAEQKAYWEEQIQKGGLSVEQLNKYKTALQQVKDTIKDRTIKDGMVALFGSTKGRSLQELEKMKKALMAMKNILPSTSPNLAKIEKQMQAIAREEDKINGKTVDVKNVMANLKTVPLDKLQKAAEQLRKELEGAKRGTNDYILKSRQLSSIQNQIDNVNRAYGQQRSLLEGIGSQIRSQLVSYFGITRLISAGLKTKDEIPKLSDEMTNVQKVTSLADDEIKQMTRDLQSLDTRTAREELMKLAEQAGKLGLANEYGVQGLTQFVSEAQKIISTVGEDAGGAEAITQILKINDLVNKGNKDSVETSLNKIGSAILNIGNNSKASYKDIIDFTKRLGATAQTANLTMTQVMALGGTFSALGGTMEQSSTAMIRLLIGLQTKTEDVANAAGLGVGTLQELIKHGDTFEAMNMVLEAVGGNLSKINAVMKAMGGRSGAQITNSIALLSGNMGTLNMQLGLANKGYDEATLLTYEFERANSNLAGTIKRLHNYWQEIFVNPSTESAMATWVRGWYKFNRILVETPGLFTAITTAIGFFTAMTVSASVVNFKFLTTLKETGLMVVRNTKDLFLAIPAMLGFKNATDASTAALNRLKAAGFSNWLTLILTLIGTLVGWLIQMAKATKDAARAAEEMTVELDKELSLMNDLFGALKRTNQGTKERRDLITQINNTYGKYLGFMLQEKDNAEMLAAAHKQIALALREEMIQKQRNTIMDNVIKETADSISDSVSGMRNIAQKRFKGNTELTDKAVMTYMSAVDQAIANQNGGWTREGVQKEVLNIIGRQAEFKLSDGSDFFAVLNKFGASSDYINAKIRQAEQGLVADTVSKASRDFVDKNKETADKQSLNAIFNDIRDRYINMQGEYDINILLERANAWLDKSANYEDSEFVKTKKINIEAWKSGAEKKLRSLRVNTGYYGRDGVDMQNISTETLKEQLKLYQKVMDKARPGVNYGEIFPGLILGDEVNEGDPESVRADIKKRMDAIYEEFNRRGLGGNGKYGTPFSKSGNQDQWKADTRDAISTAIASLDDYYEKMETEIRKKGHELGLAEEEINRQIFSNEQRHLIQRAKLRKTLLSQTEGLGPMELAMYGISQGSVNTIQANLKRSGMEKDMEKAQLALDKDLNNVQKNILERRKKIRKVLIDDEPLEKAMEEFRSAMYEIDMLIGEGEDIASENIKAVEQARLAQLVEWSKNAYSMTAQTLRDAMSSEKNVYHEWFMTLGDDEEAVLDAMLKELQNYHDNVLKAEKPILDHIERYVKIQWKAQGFEERNAQRQARGGEMVGAVKSLDQISGGSGNYTFDAELNLIKMKMEAKEDYIGLLEEEIKGEIALKKAEEDRIATEIASLRTKSAMAESDEERIASEKKIAELEGELAVARQLTQQTEESAEVARASAYKELNALQDEYINKSIEKMHKFDQLFKSMTDSLASNAEAFGAGIFGSKEDRAQAGRDAVKTVLSTMKQIAQAYLVDLNTKMLVERQKDAISEVYAKKEQLRKVQELGDYAATTSAQVALDSAKATAKAASRSLWTGLAIGAAISVALSTILGAAMAKVNSAKSSMGGGSSASRLVTGMLTYANGRYPTYAEGRYQVNGNDGRVYNAKYEDRLNTGVYGGGAHFGIFSEKMPEAVIDGKTTQRLMMNYPYIWDAITTLSKTGSLNGRVFMPTMADGNIGEIGGGSIGNAEVMVALTNTLALLQAQLANGIRADINMYGDDGLRKQLQRAEKFAKMNRME